MTLALGTAHEQTQTLLAQTIIANSLPHMELDDSSMISTPPEMEPVMECSLMLTTLSEVTFKVSLSVAKFDRFENLEDQVMDYLASVTDLKVFGCSIVLQTATTDTPRGPNLGLATARHGIQHCLQELQCYSAISRTT